MIIRLKDVSKIYTIGDETLYALNKACLSIEKGEFVAIIGPSGSGKSTMMNIIGCLDTADEGEYDFNGQPIEDYTEDELARIRNRRSALYSRTLIFCPSLRQLKMWSFRSRLSNMHSKERRERAQLALERMGLRERVGHKPTELSGGQQQRVAIARALS